MIRFLLRAIVEVWRTAMYNNAVDKARARQVLDELLPCPATRIGDSNTWKVDLCPPPSTDPDDIWETPEHKLYSFDYIGPELSASDRAVRVERRQRLNMVDGTTPREGRDLIIEEMKIYRKHRPGKRRGIDYAPVIETWDRSGRQRYEG